MVLIVIKYAITKGASPATTSAKTQGGFQAKFLRFLKAAGSPQHTHKNGKSLDWASLRLSFIDFLPISRLLFPLARKLLNGVAPRRQLRFLDDQYGEAILDLEFQGTALAHEVIGFERQPGVAGVKRAAEDFEKIGTYHGQLQGGAGLLAGKLAFSIGIDEQFINEQPLPCRRAHDLDVAAANVFHFDGDGSNRLGGGVGLAGQRRRLAKLLAV